MHSHLYALQHSLQYTFDAHTTLFYRLLFTKQTRDFGSMLTVPYIIGAEFLDW